MIVILMGVCACGKTTIGRLLSTELNWPLYDGDDYHSETNRAKMAAGVALTDDDRTVWLQSLSDIGRKETENGRSAIIACSALKFAYRNALRGQSETNKEESAAAETRFVYLKLSQETAEKRLQERKGHFFSAQLVKSQFEILEEPMEENEKGTLTIDATLSLTEIIRVVKEWIQG